MDRGEQDALTRLRDAVSEAGGPSAVAKATGMRPTHLLNVLGGHRPLGKETAVRLRAHLTLPADVWGDLLAPQQPQA